MADDEIKRDVIHLSSDAALRREIQQLFDQIQEQLALRQALLERIQGGIDEVIELIQGRVE